jgi:integrase
MPRKPFFREFDGWWYVQLQGPEGTRPQVKLVKGRENEQEAYRAFCRVMAEQAGAGKTPLPARLTVEAVSDLFLEFSSKHHEEDTYEWYRYFLQSFCDHCGKMEARDIKPFHVNRWVDAHTAWSDGGGRSAITCVKRLFNWAEGEGLLAENPIRKLKKPKGSARDRLLSKDERKAIFAAIRDEEFRQFVFAMQETGCRPSEIARVEAQHVDMEQGVWIFPKHKTRKKTGKPRVVYLTPAMVALTRALLERHPTGPLFRGPSGRPFTRNGVRCRFRRLRAKLPHLRHFISYNYRHTYATEALEAGVGMAQVAELLGHTSTVMLSRHYSKLSQKVQHLRAMAAKVSPAEENTTP